MRLRVTQAISALLAVIGLVLVGKGALGGGAAAVVIGVLFVVAGVGRLYLSRR